MDLLYKLSLSVLVCSGAALHAWEEPLHTISIDIKVSCPMSEEFNAFVQSIPHGQSVSYEEWRDGFVNNMTQLIYLAESGKIASSSWSVKTDDDLEHPPKDSQ
jgi:hypothetical protein